MELKKLREQKAALLADMRKLVDAANGESRGFTDDEKTKYADLRKQVNELNERIEALEQLEEEERQLQEPVQKPEARAQQKDDGLTAEERSFVAIIRGMKEQRNDVNMTPAANSAGAAIPTTVARKIIELVKDRCPIFQLADTYYVKGTLVIPVEDSTGGITAGYADEFSTTEGSAEKLSSVTLTGYLIKALTKVSKSLLNNSDIDLFNYAVNKLADAMQDKVELEYLMGTANKIAGLKAGIAAANTVTAAATNAVTLDELIDVQDKVKDIYQKDAIWIMNSATRTAIRKLKDQQNRYQLEPDPTARWGYKLFGKDVYCSDNMPAMAAGAYAIFYGDMSGLASKVSEEIDITVLLEKYAEQHAIGIVAFTELDAKVENTQKLSCLKMKAS